MKKIDIFMLSVGQQVAVLGALGFATREVYGEFVEVDGEQINYDSLGDKIQAVLGLSFGDRGDSHKQTQEKLDSVRMRLERSLMKGECVCPTGSHDTEDIHFDGCPVGIKNHPKPLWTLTLNIGRMVNDIDTATRPELALARDWTRENAADLSVNCEVRSVCTMFYTLLCKQIAKF